jgi:cytochrome c-type biogenesis protein CcmH
MVLWIAMAALAAAVCLPLLMALGRPPRAAHGAAGGAMAIYRDQLDELDRDVARGIVAGSEAGAARTEIARRLIREGEALPIEARPDERLRKVAVAAIVAMPIAALGLYLLIGSPTDPDQPLASRPDALARNEISRLVATVEAHLVAVPGDGKGWEVLAPVYERLGRGADAVNAYSKAIELLGPTATREADLGEAIVHTSQGAVTPEAHAAFEQALQLDPSDPRPAFYTALELSQKGKTAEARTAWRALLASAPADASWVPLAHQQLAALDTPAPGPGADDVAAAASMAPADRTRMIEGMVASLAERLKTQPDDVAGWARLIRSYLVLGHTADAGAALTNARTALAGDAAKLAEVNAAAAELGLAQGTP